MLRKGYQHGFPESVWQAARSGAREAMVRHARNKSLLTYSDLVSEIGSISFAPNDPRLFHLLGEVSSDEDDEERGLLTALVVHKHDFRPGKGFFELARSRGRTVTDEDAFWSAELARVYDIWSPGGKD